VLTCVCTDRVCAYAVRHITQILDFLQTAESYFYVTKYSILAF